MKKKILMTLMILVGILGFTIKTNADTGAAPATIQTGDVVAMQQYVPGIEVYYKPLANGKFAYCEAARLKYSTGVTMKLVGPVDDGFVYIMNNKPATGDNSKNYYILQVATWWYKDIINGNNNNISASAKQYMNAHVGDSIICKNIVDLVNGAQGFKQEVGSIAFSSNNVTFTKIGDYYVSDAITITSNNMTSLNKLQFVSAPTGTSLYSDNTKNGNGTFQVKVPVSSVVAGSTINFSIKISGTYGIGKVYEYYYNPDFQKVIYDRVFTTSYNAEASKNMGLTTTVKKTNQLAITKVDENGKSVEGAGLTLYKGNCVNSTCSDKYSTWTTDTTSKVFTDIAVGTYTLVETSTPNGYRTAEKMLITVDSDDKTFSYSMVDYPENKVRISKTDVTGEKELPGATLVVKDSTGKEVATWVSTNEPKYLTLDEGEYSLAETIAPEGYTRSTTTIIFKIDKSGNIYEKNSNGEYTKVEYIKMVNDVKPVVNISKLDSDTNEYVSGATLVVKNEKGETVATWTTSDESYYISLDSGIYTLTETNAPEGYQLNPEVMYFKITDAGKLQVKNEQGEYVDASGIIMYNVPKGEVVEVPKTGLSSTLTYIIGTLTLVAGAIVLVRNEKKC